MKTILIALALCAAQAQPAGRTAPAKKGLVTDIEKQTLQNAAFRRVLYTGRQMQLVLMTLKPGEEIGLETHDDVDQFFRFESGAGEIWINGSRSAVGAGTAALVPAGVAHNVKNTGKEPLKLYTLYAPPQHEDDTVQGSKAEAERSEEHFGGKTTE